MKLSLRPHAWNSFGLNSTLRNTLLTEGSLEVKLLTYGQMKQQWCEQSEKRKSQKRKTKKGERDRERERERQKRRSQRKERVSRKKVKLRKKVEKSQSIVFFIVFSNVL